MKILSDKDFPISEETAIAIGLFDGIHAGHMELVNDVKSRRGLRSTIYTFDIKPKADELILTPEEKQSVFTHKGIDNYFVRRFDKHFSKMTPEQFIDSLLRDFNMKHLTVGFDFRFGKGAEGDTKLLEQKSKEHGFSLSVIPEVKIDGMKVSSSLIRKLLKEGDVGEAARLMGHLYFITGNIEQGMRLGNNIGFPTANITTSKLLPLYGVYATLVMAKGKLFRAVTNVGVKPTVQDEGLPNIETFILDFDGDIYGESIQVFFAGFIRREMKFESVSELKKQIALDSASASRMLADLEVYKPFIIC